MGAYIPWVGRGGHKKTQALISPTICYQVLEVRALGFEVTVSGDAFNLILHAILLLEGHQCHREGGGEIMVSDKGALYGH